MVSLTSRTLDVINKLYSKVLSQTQSLDTHIHFAISILYPFFFLSTSLDPYYPYNSSSPTTHTHTIHPRMYMRRYIHVCTPTDGRPVERSLWSQLGSNITRDRPVRGVSIRQTHTRGFHPCYHLAARPHLVNSALLYEHTHTYTSYMFVYESWLEVLIYGGGNKRKRERKIEIRRGDD